jgi:hypothetical protein
MVADLAKLSAELAGEASQTRAAKRLEELIESWIAPLVDQATATVEGLAVPNREQVSLYYLPLWIWHRLERARWDCSRIPFRIGKKQLSMDVDHLVAAKAWERMTLPLGQERAQDLTSVVNQLGNCWLMEKNFNISKADQPLADFLGRVHEFSSGSLKIPEWAAPLLITDQLLDPQQAGVKAVETAIEHRTRRIKDDLKAFVGGRKLIFSEVSDL